MKILVADDAKTTREMFKYYFSYFDIHDIQEAINGKDAVEMCKENDYDLVFMDVNMPILDGISATKLIKDLGKDTIIICVSGDRKASTINNIIKSGAQDYIIKPLNPQLIKQRIRNYIKMAESKKIISTKHSCINLFNKNCYSFFTVFKIFQKNDFNQFIDFMHSSHAHGCENIEKCNRCTSKLALNAISNLSQIFLKMSIKFLIFVEQHKTGFYFTITGIKNLNQSVVEEIISSQLREASKIMKFKIVYNKLSIYAPILLDSDSNTCDIDNGEISLAMGSAEEELTVYNFIEQDDLSELNECITELESTFSVLQYSSLKHSEVNNISDIVKKIAFCLSSYNETYNISMTLKSLSLDIKENSDTFIEKSKVMSTIFINFSLDLKEWQEALFAKGAPSIDFMDDTIIANSCYIANLIKPQTQTDTDEDLDDIFSF
jgi:CheY-like chemotaxis protein